MKRYGLLLAPLLTLTACGTAEAPTEPEVVVSPTPTVSATPGSTAPPPVDAAARDVAFIEAPDATRAPTTTAAATAYPGTWLGVCTKLSDCNCSDWPTASTCVTEMSSGYEAGLAQAVAMGLPVEMLDQAQMTPDKLAEISNESCPTLCELASEFNAARRALRVP